MVRPGTGQSQAPLDCLGPELVAGGHGRIKLMSAAAMAPHSSQAITPSTAKISSVVLTTAMADGLMGAPAGLGAGKMSGVGILYPI